MAACQVTAQSSRPWPDSRLGMNSLPYLLGSRGEVKGSHRVDMGTIPSLLKSFLK